ncbi:MAG: hypothetical protein SVU32_01910, partial [Candidatus Nanohaloarchaea archaeon]|nr:hypothetical protein [Candidatus Nanohaloarchaea archaeon]
MFDAYDPDHTPLLNQDDNLPDDSEMDAYTASQILLTAEEAGERGYDCIEERLDSKVEDYL